MQVFVKSLTGRTYTIEITPQDRICMMRAAVCDRTGMPPQTQKLVFRGCDIADSPTLCDYGITAEDTFHLITRPLSPFPIPVFEPPFPKNPTLLQTITSFLPSFLSSDEKETDVKELMMWTSEIKRWKESVARALVEKEDTWTIRGESKEGLVLSTQVVGQEGQKGEVFIHIEASPHETYQRIRLLTPVHHLHFYCPTGKERQTNNEGEKEEEDKVPWGSLIVAPTLDRTDYLLGTIDKKLDYLRKWITEAPQPVQSSEIDPGHFIGALHPWVEKWNHTEERIKEHEETMRLYVFGEWDPTLHKRSTKEFKRLVVTLLMTFKRLQPSLPWMVQSEIIRLLSVHHHITEFRKSILIPNRKKVLDVMDTEMASANELGRKIRAERKASTEECFDMDEYD